MFAFVEIKRSRERESLVTMIRESLNQVKLTPILKLNLRALIPLTWMKMVCLF